MKKLIRYVRDRLPYLCFTLIVLTNVVLGCLTISSKMHLWNRVDGTYDCVTPNELTRVPGFKFTYQHQDECELFPKEKVSVSLNVFYLYWYSIFEDPADAVLNNLNNLIIEWKSRKMHFNNGYKMDGTLVAEGIAVGLAHGKDHIEVYAPLGVDIHETSFVHELIHVSINAANGFDHGDPDHEGQKYPGWTKDHTRLMGEVNEALQAIMEATYGP